MERCLILLLASSLAGCASWRWSGAPNRDEAAAARVLRSPGQDELHPPPDSGAREERTLSLSTASAAARRRVPVPASTPEQLRNAQYYSDLGPETIDLSELPIQQRHNYRVYAEACTRCHGLARSLNAPYADRRWWTFYVTSMRVRARLAGRSFTKEELKAVLDFLEYDGRERKLGRAREFEAQTEELRRRFDVLVEDRLRRLQQQPQPRLLHE